MGRTRLLLLAVFMASCLGNPASAVFAQNQGAHAALSGLTAIHPVIRYFEDAAPRPRAAAATQLQSDVERILSDNGIAITDSAEFDRLVGARNYPIAMLQLDLRMANHPDQDMKSYLVSCHIRQPVFLSRKPVVRFLATTWESTDFGMTKDVAFARGVAKEALGRFIQEWRAQNPK